MNLPFHTSTFDNMTFKAAPFDQEPVSLRRLSKLYWKETVICFLIAFDLFTWTRGWKPYFEGTNTNEC